MPHLIVEHSANIADVTDIGALVGAVHAAALATGVAPFDALRTRAVSSDIYAVADRHPDNAFIAVTARFGAGRQEADKQLVIDAVMSALEASLGAAQQTMMLSVEYQEIDPDWRVNKNNLRQVIAERGATDGG